MREGGECFARMSKKVETLNTEDRNYVMVAAAASARGRGSGIVVLYSIGQVTIGDWMQVWEAMGNVEGGWVGGRAQVASSAMDDTGTYY